MTNPTLSKPGWPTWKLYLIGLVIIVAAILAVTVNLRPAAVEVPDLPCVPVLSVFVDVDGNGTIDLLTEGCVIYNQPPSQAQVIPTPPIYPELTYEEWVESMVNPTPTPDPQ